MKPFMKRLSQGLLLVVGAYCEASLARVGCFWGVGGGVSIYQRSVGTLYVPRDAAMGTVIGAVDISHFTGNQQRNYLTCEATDYTTRLQFNARPTAPLFTGMLDPINGEDVTGKIFKTNIDGIGVRIKLVFPFDGSAANAFEPIGEPTVPFDAEYQQAPSDPVPFRLGSVRNEVTLVKIGPLQPGAHTFNGAELWSGHFPNVGKALSYGITGTIIQAQCSVSSNPVSADPVQLGDWDTADFTGPGYTTTAIPFSITLNACETDPGGGSIATAHIQLEGVKGSAPIGPTTNGVFSLTSDSDAQGLGIQLLKADGVTPMELSTEVPLIAISPGVTVLDFNARFYQTGASSAVRPGTAKGALSFTVTYR